MTAEVLSLDGARVSARVGLDADHLDEVDYVLARLKRQVKREADKTFGVDTPRRSYIYIGWEEVVEPPEPPAAA